MFQLKKALGKLSSMTQAEHGSEIRRDHKKRLLQKIIEVFLNHEDLITIPKVGAVRTAGNSLQIDLNLGMGRFAIYVLAIEDKAAFSFLSICWECNVSRINENQELS